MLGRARSYSWPEARNETRRIRQAEVEASTLESRAVKVPYTRLAVGEIRLLDLFPGVDHEPLRATLRVVSLASAPSYLAVSYPWGSTDRTKSLILDERSIGITESLFAVLRKFRKRARTETLWADAICINQDDEFEKGCQLNLMASIYRDAEGVLVYLGEHRPGHTLACWMIVWLYRHGGIYDEYAEKHGFSKRFFFQHFEQYLTGKGADLKCFCCREEFRFRWKAASISGRLHEGLRAVKDLLDSAWFRRLWTLQENAVAQFSVLFFGQHRTTWELLASAIRVCDGYMLCESPFTMKEREIFHRAAGNELVVAQYCDLIKESQRAEYLLEVMILTWNLESRFAKDRLNSIRALAFVEHEVTLQLDMNLHISSFWFQVACFLLRNQSRKAEDDPPLCRSFLLTLAGLQHDRKDPLLPSWVPDLAILDGQSYEKHYNSLVNGRSNRAGGPSRRFLVDITSSPGTLFVRSIYLSEIIETMPSTKYPSRSNNWEDELRRSDCDDKVFLSPDHSLNAKHKNQDWDLHDPPAPETAAWEDHYWSEIQDRLFPWYMICYDFAYVKYKDSIEAEYKVNDFSTLLTQGSIFNTPKVAHDIDAVPRRRQVILERASKLLHDLRRDGGSDAPSQPTPEQFYDDMMIYLHPRMFAFNLFLDTARILAHFSDGRVGWVPEHAQKGDIVYLLQGAREPYILRPVGVRLVSHPDAPLFTVVGDAYIPDVMRGEAWPTDFKPTDDDTIGLI